MAKRTMSVGPLHYSAFELRYGIEYLLFELLTLTKAEITEDDDDLSWALSDEFVAKGEMVMLEKGEAELGAIA